MHRLLAAGALLALFTTLAIADDVPRYAGTKGTVTAWDETSTRVLEHRFCVKTRYSWDYPSCSNRLRDALKRHVCATQGAGTHKYLFQMGDSKPYPATVYCR